jgi:hypothetical protein
MKSSFLSFTSFISALYLPPRRAGPLRDNLFCYHDLLCQYIFFMHHFQVIGAGSKTLYR